MDTISDIAIVIALVRDIVFLLLLAVALTLLLIVMFAIRRLLNAAEGTAETVQDAVKKVSENLVEPAASEAGTARKVGRAAGFLWGFFGGGRRKKSSDKS